MSEHAQTATAELTDTTAESAEETPRKREIPLLAPGPKGDLYAVYRFVNPRMFESDFLEFFSKVHPAVPGALYAPLVLAMLGWSLWTHASVGGVLGTLLVAFLGFFAWTFTEYSLHRFYFHMPTNSTLTKFLYYYSHGIHHQYPDDFYRLLMPPSLSLPLAVLFWAIFSAIGGLLGASGWVPAAFAGLVGGYLYYDYSHFATHHVRPFKSEWLQPLAAVMRRQRRLHMEHHYGDHTKGFHVSGEFWDRVFGTHGQESP